MTTIVTRAGKGSSLSWSEVDTNFNNLNTDKIETSALGVTVQEFSANLDLYAGVTPTVAGLALLDDVSAAAQRTTLGLGNVDNTSDATKNAASATLTNKTILTSGTNVVEATSAPGSSGFNFRNKLINGNFDIWQRGTSQSSSGYGSADRWSCGNSGTTKTASQQPFTLGQTAVPNDPFYFIRHVVTSSAGAGNFCVLENRLEYVRQLAGKTVTLSFWAKADSNKNIAVEFQQFFGTGGSPSTSITGIGSQLVALTTAWQKKTITVTLPSIAGKTLGSNNGDFTGVTFWFDAGSSFNARTANLGQQSGTFDIAQVQLEEGTIATPFELRPIGLELSLCQRYYYRCNHPFSSGNYSAYAIGAYISEIISFPVEMRIVPTCSINTTGMTLGGVNTPTVGTCSTRHMKISSTATAISINCYWVSVAGNYFDATAEL